MANWKTPEVEELFEAILTLNTAEECQAFFEDACTIREILDIAQRFQVAGRLCKGENYAVISKETGVSTATISRVSKCLEFGSGGYRNVLEKLKEKRKNDQ